MGVVDTQLGDPTQAPEPAQAGSFQMILMETISGRHLRTLPRGTRLRHSLLRPQPLQDRGLCPEWESGLLLLWLHWGQGAAPHPSLTQLHFPVLTLAPARQAPRPLLSHTGLSRVLQAQSPSCLQALTCAVPSAPTGCPSFSSPRVPISSFRSPFCSHLHTSHLRPGPVRSLPRVHSPEPLLQGHSPLCSLA